MGKNFSSYANSYIEKEKAGWAIGSRRKGGKGKLRGELFQLSGTVS